MSPATDGRSSESLLKLEDVVYIYEERSLYGEATKVHAVDNVSLDLYSGETVAIAGESGCGKTTLGKLLVALYRPVAGKILYKGQDLYGLSRNEFGKCRLRLQIIHQDPYQALNSTKTVYKILSVPLKYNKIVKGDEALRKRVDELLSSVGLAPEIGRRYPHQLSGGQRQRVVIARAISLHPELIVADEPVSMIDVSLRIEVLDLLLKLKRNLNMSCIFITHDFGLARYFARQGRIAVMYLGNIVEIGPTEDVLQKPLHPYTQSLISVVPVPDPDLVKERKAMQLRSLDIPSASNPPSGCKFHPRCPFAGDYCSKDRPSLREVSDNRFVACCSVE